MNFFSTSEFEMAYEALYNYINLIQIDNPEKALLLGELLKITHKFLKNRNIDRLIKNWKKIEENPESLDQNYYMFYGYSEMIFLGLNRKDWASYCYDQKEILRQDEEDYEFEITDLYELAQKSWINGNYEIAKRYFIKFIRLSHDDSILKEVIVSYSFLASYYLDHKKPRKIKKLIKNVKYIVESCEIKFEIDAALLYFYDRVGDLDNLYKILWRLINVYKQKNINTSLELSYYYLYLGKIHMEKGDYKKAHQALYNAKSCSGIQPMSNPIVVTIYMEMGRYYLNTNRYKDAIDHYESIIEYCDEKYLPDVKFNIGVAYYYMENYDTSLQYFIELEEFLLSKQNTNEYMIFEISVIAGKLYSCIENLEKTEFYFNKAFELINHLEMEEIKESALINYAYRYWFYEKEDYEKCYAILKIKTKLLEINDDLVYKSEIFIEWSKLFFVLKKIEEGNEYLDKAEKLMNLKEVLLFPKRKINLACIQQFMRIAFIYINYKSDLPKAEMICKAIEPTINTTLPIHAALCECLFDLLQWIYSKEERWLEAKEYNQKLSNLLNEINQSQIYRNLMDISKNDIERLLKINSRIADDINENLLNNT